MSEKIITPAPGHAGIYVHIPFCIRKCPYCDFHSITDLSLIPDFIAALIKEITLTDGRLSPFDTIYIGGGTPSTLEPSMIGRIVDAIHRRCTVLPGAEITLEANPGAVDLAGMKAFRSAGVNRINIGVQSFQEENLGFLGRIHSSEEARRAMKWARKAGFDNLGIDLIHGLPNQTKRAWIEDLNEATIRGPEHLSCYMLTYESGVPLDRDRLMGTFHPLPESTSAELFTTTMEYLEARGYAQYEISNFARTPGHRSRHNQKYWTHAPYLGFGPSAHAFIPPERRWNRSGVEEYIRCLRAGETPVKEREILTREQQMIETIFLGLRGTDGIRMDRFEERFRVNFRGMFDPVISDLMAEGKITASGGRCALTRQGMLFLDSIAGMLIDALNPVPQ